MMFFFKLYGLDYSIYRKVRKFFYLIPLLIFLFIYPFLYLDAIFVSIVLSVVIIAIIFYFPYFIEKSYIANLEKELPYFLLSLDLDLLFGKDFFSALRESSRKYDYISKIYDVFFRYKKTNGFSKASIYISKNIKSKDFARAIALISNIYRNGYRRFYLDKLANDILDKQAVDAKAYSNKLVMYSLLFIAITAILPSLYLIFVSIASAVLEFDISINNISLFFFFIFPLAVLIFVFFVYLQMPNHMR